MRLASEIVDLPVLLQLAANYWARADGDVEPPMAEIFTEDAVLVLGSLTLMGRAAIEQFFRERDAAQRATQRTTRHIACNHRAQALEGGRVRVRSTVLVYVGTGPLPLPSGAPAAIADFEDVCVPGNAGAWLFERRAGRTVFIGAGVAPFAAELQRCTNP